MSAIHFPQRSLQYPVVMRRWLLLVLSVGMALVPLPTILLWLSGNGIGRVVWEAGPAGGPASCYAEYTGDNTPDFSSSDAQAVRNAVAAATTGSVVKVAGYCSGVSSQNGSVQVTLITRTLTLAGGYTVTDWINAYPLTQPTTLDGLGAGRVLSVTAAATVQGLTLTNGYVTNSPGGGLYTVQPITLASMTFYSNVVTGTTGTRQGGGAYFGGVAQISGTAFLSNTSYAEGGGLLIGAGGSTLTNTTFIGNRSTNSEAGGLRVLVSSAVVADGLYFYNNRALSGGGGAGSWDGPNGQMSNSQVISNSAQGPGGGFYFNQAATLANTQFVSNTSTNNGGGANFNSTAQVFNAAFSANTSGGHGGGAYFNAVGYLTNTTFSNNFATNNGGGVYFFNFFNTASLTNTTFSANTAGNGGGAYIRGRAGITNTTFTGNTANTSGGGVYFFTYVYVTNTVFSNNTAAANGGGAYMANPNDQQFVNSLFANNDANNGAALYAEFPAPSLRLIHLTIAHPTASNRSAIYVAGGTVILTNSIVASHTVGIERAGGTASENYNLFSNVATPYSGSVTSGGNSITGTAGFYNTTWYTLTQSSSAIDAGVNAGIDSDYFGDPRPQGAGYDMGFDESPFTPLYACYATPDNGTTVFGSNDAGALREALAAAAPDGTVKVAGTCAGTVNQDGTDQIALITQTLTLAGGYASTNWTTAYPLTQTTTLDAQSGGRGLLLSAAATLQDLTIVNGTIDGSGGGLVTTAALTLTHVTLANNTANNGGGGGAYIIGPALLTDSTIISNTATGDAQDGGGAVFESAASLTNTTFSANSAPDQGGGAWFNGPATLVATNFISNTSASAGAGALFNDTANISASTFDANNGGTGGGAFFAQTADITNTTFSANTSSNAGGGVYGVQPAHISDSTFVSNTANNGGGGAFFEQTAHITGSTFSANIAGDGGGAYFVQMSQVSDTVFSGNTTTVGVGGGARFDSEVTLTNVAFLTNTAASDGGGAYFVQTSQISDTVFSGNTSDQWGGGAYSAGAVTVTNTTFTTNTAAHYGGGLFVDNAATLYQTSFVSNTAGDSGGGVQIQAEAIIAASTFTSNTALSGGGGAYLSGVGTVSDSDFSGNQTVGPSADGGGLRASGNATVTNATFTSNHSTRNGGGLVTFNALTLTASSFTSNTAQSSGGGAYLNAASTISATTFDRNQTLASTADGGGLRVASGATLTNLTFTNNRAGRNGGGLYATGALTLTTSSLSNNTATGVGGGIYLVTNTVQISTTSLTTNTAAYAGGLYQAGNATLSATALTLTDNLAASGAGGLGLDGPARIQNSLLSDNRSDDGAGIGTGGGLQMGSSLARVTFTDTVFSRNVAAGANDDGGGAIMVYNGALTLTRVALIDNYAATHGGGLSLFSGVTGTVYIVNSLFAGNSASLGGQAISQRVDRSFTLVHTTIATPTVASGAAVEITAGSAYLTNTLIASYTVGLSNVGGTLSEDYNLFSDVTTPYSGSVLSGGNSITGSAAFYNTMYYTLTAASSAMDAGVNIGINDDYFGDMRPQGNGYDIGYDEALVAEYKLYLSLIRR